MTMPDTKRILAPDPLRRSILGGKPKCCLTKLVGTDLRSLSARQLSTYKVIRAVAEVECLGFFDSLNAYDNAIVSLGPCHWTAGIVARNGTVDEGELCAFLSYLKHADSVAYHQAFGFFGVGIADAWVNSAGVANGSNLWQSSSRKYTSWLTQQQDDGSYRPVPALEADANYFKNWHWFYRLSMAGRTIFGISKENVRFRSHSIARHYDGTVPQRRR